MSTLRKSRIVAAVALLLGSYGVASAGTPALAAGAGPGASVALIATDLAAGGWLLVGLAAAAVVGLFLCRDHRSPSRPARQFSRRPWTGIGLLPGRPERRLAHP